MEKSAVILKSENGAITYVIGEVVTKTKEQLESEVQELEARKAGICSQDVEAIRASYDARIEALKQEAEEAIQKAIKENELASEEVIKITESIDNLNAVLSQFNTEETKSADENAEASTEESFEPDEAPQPTFVGQAL